LDWSLKQPVRGLHGVIAYNGVVAQRSSRPDRLVQRRQRRAAFVRRGVAVAPTMMTLGNLLCGFASIFVVSRPTAEGFPFGWTRPTLAVMFIFLGMLLDGLDGRVARMTRSESDLGEQLDSMADMLTFGVAPAFIVIQLVGVESPFVGRADDVFDRVALVVAGIYVACAAMRLARFNIETVEDDDPQHDYFKGMPTPGAAGTVASLVLWHQLFFAKYDPTHWLVQTAAVTMVVIALLVALAMVSRLEYMHVMNLYIRRRASFHTFVIVGIVAGMLMLQPQSSLAAAMVAYALSAPLMQLWRWRKKKTKLE